MIIIITVIQEQQDILDSHTITLDGVIKALLENKLNWMKNNGFTYNNCSLTVAPSAGEVTITTGQENFLLLDMADIADWLQNAVDAKIRHINQIGALII